MHFFLLTVRAVLHFFLSPLRSFFFYWDDKNKKRKKKKSVPVIFRGRWLLLPFVIKSLLCPCDSFVLLNCQSVGLHGTTFNTFHFYFDILFFVPLHPSTPPLPFHFVIFHIRYFLQLVGICSDVHRDVRNWPSVSSWHICIKTRPLLRSTQLNRRTISSLLLALFLTL